MWGIFFEDINFGADGGLYAELVKNRSFDFPDPLMGWFKLSPKGAPGTLAVRDEQPFHVRNPHYLRIESPGGNSPFGIANEGFRGMGVKAGEAYQFSAHVRKIGGNARLRVELYSAAGTWLDRIKATNPLNKDFLTDNSFAHSIVASSRRAGLEVEGSTILTAGGESVRGWRNLVESGAKNCEPGY